MLNNLKKRFQEGFTLVEILIVVVIIGILAAIAIPTYFKYVERGYASDAKVQMKNILENAKLYYSYIKLINNNNQTIDDLIRILEDTHIKVEKYRSSLKFDFNFIISL